MGHVGAVTAGCLAALGHEILAIDTDPLVVAGISAGIAPVREPGLDELFREAAQSGRLRPASYAELARIGVDAILVCVGSPARADGSLDLTQVEAAAGEIGAVLRERREPGPCSVVFRSTMTPGSMEAVVLGALGAAATFPAGATYAVAYQPEFIREGNALADFYHPARTVVGGQPAAVAAVRELFAFTGAPTFETSFRTAEAAKLMDNAFHALKVGFANEIGRYAASLGIGVGQLFDIFLVDRQLNTSDKYLSPGLSFGGPCLPKDVSALGAAIRSVGLSAPVIESLLASNEAHTEFLLRRIRGAVAPGARLLLTGLSFKPGTSDLRGSVLLEIASRMIEEGFTLEIFDPELSGKAIASLPPAVRSRVLAELPPGEVPWAMVLAGRQIALSSEIAAVVPILRIDLLQ